MDILENPDSKAGEQSQQSQSNQSALANRSQNVRRQQLQSNEDIRLNYPSRDRTYFSQLYNQPLVTTLTSFSQVANLVRNPYELINNVDEFVRHAGGSNKRRTFKSSENFARTSDQNRHSLTPVGEPVSREMDTFVADDQLNRSDLTCNAITTEPPIPMLPPIDASIKRGRLESLTIEEYETKFRQSATDLELIERVFAGSLATNQLRAALWPYLFGLVLHRGKFDRIYNEDGKDAYVFIEHQANNKRWNELKDLFEVYQSQWMAILPEQEIRFSTFRDRKSLIERDVIRCDRLHLFYSDETQHLDKLTNLLMTYMMYDFDIGYVQGMSDLAGPILCMYGGDIVKSFWIFVEVMKLFRRNFEYTQNTILFQLSCLYELVKNTDPLFAQYLEENESSNCFFAFRAIVCQFKRELMKKDEDDYTNVLFLWDTIWCVERKRVLQDEMDKLVNDTVMTDCEKSRDADQQMAQTTAEQSSQDSVHPFAIHVDPNQADSARYKLTETEIFVLSLCLSMIRRERDIIMANKLDGTGIHRHFIDPKLGNNLNGFIEHAINIYSFLKKDFDLTKLTSPKPLQDQPKHSPDSTESNANASPPSADGYDSLSDFLIINGASGS